MKSRTFAADFELTFLANGRQKNPAKQKKTYRIPIAIAREWRSLAGDGPNQADLYRMLGVSRARVTQVLQLLPGRR